MSKSLLIISSTINEILPFFNHFKITNFKQTNNSITINKWTVDFLITEVGAINTCYNLLNHLTKIETNYHQIIQGGIAGSFSKNLKLGEVVLVKTNIFSELGVEDGEDFIPIKKLSLGNSICFDKLINPQNLIPLANYLGISQINSSTVNKVHGEKKSITSHNLHFDSQIETMEGGALSYICLKKKLNFIELRSISNFIEKRNKNNWEINLAINNLNNYLIKAVNYLTNEKNTYTK